MIIIQAEKFGPTFIGNLDFLKKMEEDCEKERGRKIVNKNIIEQGRIKDFNFVGAEC